MLEGNGLMEQTSITTEEQDPWWQVDLERNCTLDTVTLYNRTDMGQDSLKNYRVSVLDDQGKTVWTSVQTSPPRPAATLALGGVSGRTIKIQLKDTSSLALAEVVVTGNED